MIFCPFQFLFENVFYHIFVHISFYSCLHGAYRIEKHFRFAFTFVNKDLFSFKLPFLFMRVKPTFSAFKSIKH